VVAASDKTMTDRISKKKLCWLVPDDNGGGVVSVALSCCRQAQLAGYEATLLMLLSPSGHISEHVRFELVSLNVVPPGFDAPEKIVQWLSENPQDVLFLNGCEQADVAIPNIPNRTTSVYVVHDTASRYWRPALKNEQELDAIVAVSETVATAFREQLQRPEKLTVLHNGTLFPADVDVAEAEPRAQEMLFLGGDDPVKGSYDVLKLWPKLVARGFSGRLHWFGEINTAFRGKIEKLPRASSIVLHGRVVRSQIFRQAACARVLLMLSRAEPFGMVTIECMGMGALPVAWDVKSGTKEIVEENYPFFASLGNYNQLADRVLQACNEHTLHFRAALRRTREQFGEASMWRRYAVFIDEAVHSSAVKRAKAGQRPPAFKPQLRLLQLLPNELRATIREILGRSARWGYRLRNLRGI
jgi:glycosyltransferase involved in cell wall biosynthesis